MGGSKRRVYREKEPNIIAVLKVPKGEMPRVEDQWLRTF